MAEALVESKAGRDPFGEIAQLGAVVKRWYEWEHTKQKKVERMRELLDEMAKLEKG